MNHRIKAALIAIGLVLGAFILIAVTDDAEAHAQPVEYGCELYGCLYGHHDGHYQRSGGGDVEYGIAHELLPDGGPDNRFFVEVLWPGDYDPAQRSRWDRVAQCESTQRWHIATGNGFYGGLQFTRSTWLAFGGGQYAQYAHHATPEQQIDIGINVAYQGYGQHGPQGPGAWPHCGGPLYR